MLLFFSRQWHDDDDDDDDDGSGKYVIPSSTRTTSSSTRRTNNNNNNNSHRNNNTLPRRQPFLSIFLMVFLLLGSYCSNNTFVTAADASDSDAKTLLLSTGENVHEFIDKYINEHDIMVFGKSTCKYCKNTKKIVDRMHKKTNNKGWDARFLYLDYMNTDGPKIYHALLDRTGGSSNTIPIIFISGEFLAGGNTELTNLYKSGDLFKTIKNIIKRKLSSATKQEEQKEQQP